MNLTIPHPTRSSKIYPPVMRANASHRASDPRPSGARPLTARVPAAQPGVMRALSAPAATRALTNASARSRAIARASPQSAEPTRTTRGDEFNVPEGCQLAVFASG